MISLEVDQNPFQARQLARMDPDPFTNLKIRPRLGRDLRADCQLKSLNFTILYWHWGPAATNHLQDTRGYHHWPPLRILKTAKEVSWEEGLLDFLPSVRPLSNGLVFRKEALEALAF